MKKGEIIKHSELESRGLEEVICNGRFAVLKKKKHNEFYDCIYFGNGESSQYQVISTYKAPFLTWYIATKQKGGGG